MYNKEEFYWFAEEFFIDRLNLSHVKFKHERFILPRYYRGQASATFACDSGNLIYNDNLGIEVGRFFDPYDEIFVLAHELVHISQYVSGLAQFKGENGVRYYGGSKDHFDYGKRQIEKWANKQGENLVHLYLSKYRHKMGFFTRIKFELFNIFKGRFI